MLNPRLFTVRGFVCSAAVGVSVYGAALFASTYLVPLSRRRCRATRPTRAGGCC